ncbi:type II and III secretion system protein family protein [Massilia sp. TS11]|uniref:type II and III secretion system protein family protein n=1 Tax=Massilia sp. TS11 TaxID=2908003 RepID=UPI001EDA0C14|nr:type II and III secretion system protein family protein [Massilia sp. TS11]MCG2585808.1 type II and III secretion system protein family protein [Massilia sp. TS11]
MIGRLVPCLPLLIAMHAAWGAAPPRTPAKPAAPMPEHTVSGPACSGAATPTEIALVVGKSTLMRMPEPVANRSLGNPAVAQAMLVSPDTLYLVGMDLGSTNVIVQGRSGACNVIDVHVGMDISAVQLALANTMPEEKQIKVQAVGDAIVLSGVVSDSQAVARAQEIAAAFVRRPLRSLATRKNEDQDQPAREQGPVGESRIVNLLTVLGAQQVMLEVKVAEVSKSLLEKVEGNSLLKLSSGSWVATAAAAFVTGQLKSGVQAAKSNGNKIGFDAQKENNLVRVLAEPTVMAISGQEGSFLAGGKFFIPVSQDNNKITLQEKEFGIGLRFRPTVLSGGRINLFVAPEVSELSREGIGVTGGGGFTPAILPVVTTRRATTTVQLMDGQTFVIGGLIKNNTVANVKAFPFLGEIPVLGALFRSTDYQNDRSELVFVVTPHLVKPLEGPVRLPTDQTPPPSPADVHVKGTVEPSVQH